MTIELPKERDLFFSYQFDQKTIMELTKAIICINSNDDKLAVIYKSNNIKYHRPPIRIFIDSYGGHVYQCLGLISIIENSKTEIHTIATGAAMSCGFMLLISGHKRFAYTHSTMMFHQVSSGTYGKVQDMLEEQIEVERLQLFLEKLTIRKTKITKKQLKKNRKIKKDWYFNSSQAIKLGIIDKII